MYNRFQIGFSLSFTDNRLCLLAGSSRLFFVHASENQIYSASDYLTPGSFLTGGASIQLFKIIFIKPNLNFYALWIFNRRSACTRQKSSPHFLY